MSYQGAFQKDNWHNGVPSIALRNGIKSRRWGMRVTVYTGGSAGDYVLSYGLANTNIQDNANWLKVADIGQTWGGGGGGVNIYNSDGALTGDRTLDGDNFNLSFNAVGTFNLGINNLYGTAANQIALSGNEVYLTSNAGPFMISGNGGDVTIDAAGNAMLLSASTTGTFTSSMIEIYGTNNVDIRADAHAEIISFGDIRLDADTDINIDANGTFNNVAIDYNVSASNDLELVAENAADFGSLNGDVSIGAGVNISLSASSGSIIIVAETTAQLRSLNGDVTMNADAGAADIAGNAGVSIVSALGEVNIQASSDRVSIVSGSGSEINIESGTDLFLISNNSGIEMQANAGTASIYGAANVEISADTDIILNPTNNLELTIGGALTINGDAGTVGYVLTSNGALPPTWEPGGGGGGITNTAANTELGMSDGTDIVPSGVFMTTVGQAFAFGESTIAGTTRSFTAVGSQTNIGFIYQTKGTGVHSFGGNIDLGINAVTTGSTRTVTAAGTAAAISISFQSKGTGNIVLGGSGSSQIAIGSGAGDPVIGLLTGTAPSAGTINNLNFSTTNQINFTTTGTSDGAVAFIASTTEYGFVGALAGRPFVLAAVGNNPAAATGGDIEVRAGQGGTPGNGGNVILSPGLAGTGGGVAGLLIINNLPTSAAGLPAGAVWNNAGVLNIV